MKGKNNYPRRGGRPAFKNKHDSGSLPRRFGRVVGGTDTVTGTVQGSGRGYAFLIPDDGSGDLFIAAGDLGGAMHGDRVEAVRTGSRRGNGECAVTKVLSYGATSVVGVFDGRTLSPREKGMPALRAETGRGVKAEAGDIAAAEIVGREKGEPRYRITETLGRAGDNLAEIAGVIRSMKLSEKFPAAVLAEADKLPSSPDESAMLAPDRTDLRGELAVTIDGAGSRDFDDAIGVVRNGNGYRLSVHIADVAEYVAAGSKLDEEALRRGTSVYFPDRVLPMLPEKLSNGICSLNEGEDRLTLSCIMDFDREGSRLGYRIEQCVIRSAARLTYENAQKMLDGDRETCEKYGRVSEMLVVARELAELLRKRRMERGAVELDLDECEIEMVGGVVRDVRKRPRLFTHKMIEEFMLAANEAVAERFAKANVPFVYRVHEVPPPEKVEGLNDFLSPLGLSVPDRPAPSDYAALMNKVDGKVSETVSRVALRSMSKADYRPECMGHFGLAAKYYCHFTSPIRRYPDLAIHRIIKSILRREKDLDKKYSQFVTEASRVSSERERTADEAERKVDDILMASFMRDKIGCRFTARISGVTEWGVFAELDNGIEGLIRTENLPGRGYVYDEKHMLLTNGTRKFALGDEIDIVVESVEYDRVAFSLVK